MSVRIPRLSWALVLAQLARVPVVEGKPYGVEEQRFRDNERVWWNGHLLYVGEGVRPEDVLHEVAHAITTPALRRHSVNWGLDELSEDEQREAEDRAEIAGRALELGWKAATRLIP